MASDESRADVSFTTNASVIDSPFIEKTIRHMVGALDYPFVERNVVLDRRAPTGKYAKRPRGELAALEAALDRLRADGVIDNVFLLPEDPDEERALLAKYFGGADVSPTKGVPHFCYLYAWDRCSGDFFFHADSDMMFHCRPGGGWIAESINLLRDRPDAIFATLGCPPQAQNALERLFGRPLFRASESGWKEATSVSTRFFLCDKRKLEQEFLPLVQKAEGDNTEKSLTNTCAIRGLKRFSKQDPDNWAIHPVRQFDQNNYLAHLNDLIWAVESGVYPFARGGLPWDMVTDGQHLKVWLNAVRKARRGPVGG